SAIPARAAAIHCPPVTAVRREIPGRSLHRSVLRPERLTGRVPGPRKGPSDLHSFRPRRYGLRLRLRTSAPLRVPELQRIGATLATACPANRGRVSSRPRRTSTLSHYKPAAPAREASAHQPSCPLGGSPSDRRRSRTDLKKNQPIVAKVNA